MRTSDIFGFLIGREESIRRVAASRSSVWVGFVLVLTAGIAREYHRLKSENRLLQEQFWDRCTLFDVNYRPKQMSVQELEEGMMWLFREAYNKEAVRQRTRSFVEARS
jgi:hypothetical protein